MNPYQVSKDSRLTLLIDGIVLLIIGMVVGFALSQVMTSYEIETIQPTKVIRRIPAEDSTKGKDEAPKAPAGPKVEEV